MTWSSLPRCSVVSRSRSRDTCSSRSHIDRTPPRTWRLETYSSTLYSSSSRASASTWPIGLILRAARQVRLSSSSRQTGERPLHPPHDLVHLALLDDQGRQEAHGVAAAGGRHD